MNYGELEGLVGISAARINYLRLIETRIPSLPARLWIISRKRKPHGKKSRGSISHWVISDLSVRMFIEFKKNDYPREQGGRVYLFNRR